MTDWETVEVPKGSFIGWGIRAGQHVTGKVLGFNVVGGTDFNGDPCPQLEVELTEKAESFNKAGERKDIDAGEIVVVTCGQASLKNAMRRVDLNPGDLVKIELTGEAKTPKGTAKTFEVKYARGTSPATAAVQQDDDEPPF